MRHGLRNNSLSIVLSLLACPSIWVLLILLSHNGRLHIIQSVLYFQHRLPQRIKVKSSLQKAMGYAILTVLWRIDAIQILIQLAHQRVHEVPSLVTLSKCYISMLELGCHFLLQEFQSIVYHFNLFGNPERKLHIAFAIGLWLPRSWSWVRSAAILRRSLLALKRVDTSLRSKWKAILLMRPLMTLTSTCRCFILISEVDLKVINLFQLVFLIQQLRYFVQVMHSNVRVHGYVLTHVDELLLVDVVFQDGVNSANLIAPCTKAYWFRWALSVIVQSTHINWILR